jgi:hypothetical protein
LREDGTAIKLQLSVSMFGVFSLHTKYECRHHNRRYLYFENGCARCCVEAKYIVLVGSSSCPGLNWQLLVDLRHCSSPRVCDRGSTSIGFHNCNHLNILQPIDLHIVQPAPRFGTLLACSGHGLRLRLLQLWLAHRE